MSLLNGLIIKGYIKFKLFFKKIEFNKNIIQIYYNFTLQFLLKI